MRKYSQDAENRPKIEKIKTSFDKFAEDKSNFEVMALARIKERKAILSDTRMPKIDLQNYNNTKLYRKQK